MLMLQQPLCWLDFFPFTVAGPPELTKPVLARAARLERRSIEGLDEEVEVTENMLNVRQSYNCHRPGLIHYTIT